MQFWEAVVLGIVEGLTEFLPISSTGHLMLAVQVLSISPTEFVKSFEIAIQSGAILAVIVLYGRSQLRRIEVWKRILAAFVPTAIVGLLCYRFIKQVLLENTTIVLWSLLVGGILLIIFEYLHREARGAEEQIEKIPYLKAIGIGVFQTFAMIPGVSRSAATILGGLILGLKRRTIVEFSFLLAVPTMLAATALDLMKTAPVISREQFVLLAVGFLTSFGTAIVCIKIFLYFIQRHNFVIFGIYRIVLASVCILLF